MCINHGYNCFWCFKEKTNASLLKTLKTHNKSLIPLSSLCINCISDISTAYILSLKQEYTFLSSNFLIIGQCSSSANCRKATSTHRLLFLIKVTINTEAIYKCTNTSSSGFFIKNNRNHERKPVWYYFLILFQNSVYCRVIKINIVFNAITKLNINRLDFNFPMISITVSIYYIVYIDIDVMYL